MLQLISAVKYSSITAALGPGIPVLQHLCHTYMAREVEHLAQQSFLSQLP